MPVNFYKFLGKEWYAMHAQRMNAIKKNFDFKIIVREGEDLLIAQDFAQYRWFPKDMFYEKTFYAYGGSLAFMSFSDNDVEIKVLPQSEFTDSFRVLFDIAWNHIAVIPHATREA
jgi:hypothetical protein